MAGNLVFLIIQINLEIINFRTDSSCSYGRIDLMTGGCNPRLTVQTLGNVGIGTGSPSAILDINDKIFFGVTLFTKII